MTEHLLQKLTPIEHIKKQTRLKMAKRILSALSIIFGILLIFLFYDGETNLKSYLITFFFIIGGIFYLSRTNNPEPLFLFYAYSGSIITQLSTWNVEQTTHYANFIWIIICVVIAFMSGRLKSSIILLVLNVLGIAYFFFFRHNHLISTLTLYSNLKLTAEVLEIIISFSILGYLMIQTQRFQNLWEKAYLKINMELQSNIILVKRQNVENVTLLKEIHHRVKNNLQIIISLLRLQKAELNSDEAKENFEEAINRVMVISSIHQKLYKQENLSELDLKEYLEDLIEDLMLVYDTENNIEINIQCSISKINAKTIVPVGLLINELVSNSLKHAFKNVNNGVIALELDPSDIGFSIRYKDNGTWQENTGKESFGLELIQIFTEQLNGTCQLVKGEDGSTYLFNLSMQEE